MSVCAGVSVCVLVCVACNDFATGGGFRNILPGEPIHVPHC